MKFIAKLLNVPIIFDQLTSNFKLQPVFRILGGGGHTPVYSTLEIYFVIYFERSSSVEYTLKFHQLGVGTFQEKG